MTATSAAVGIQYLVEVLDAFASARRQGGAALPVVVFLAEDGSPAARNTVVGFRSRLVDQETGHSLVAHALVDGSEQGWLPGQPEPDIALFDEIAEQFEGSMPAGSGALRLPTWRICRDVLAADVGAGELRLLRLRLRDHLFEAFRARHPVLERAGELADEPSASGLAVAFLVALRPLVDWLPRWLYGRWLSRTRRLRWFAEQMRGAGGARDPDFLGCAVRLTATRRLPAATPLARQVLMLALLRDLDAAQRPSRLSMRARRREWPFVLLLTGSAAEGDVVRRFLATYTETARHLVGSPVMILAALPGPAPTVELTVVEADAPTLRETAVAMQLAAFGARAKPGGARPLAVRLPAHADDAAARAWLLTRTTAQPRPNRRSDVLRPVVATVAAAAMVVGAGVITDRSFASDACHDMWTTKSGERVGITDGSCRLSETAQGDAGEVNDVLSRIREENRKVVGDAPDSYSGPYRSVVYFVPLSVPPRQPGRKSIFGLRQLRGAFQAQKRANEQADKDPNMMHVRLLVANPGDRFAFGIEVTERLAAEVARDRTIAAVVGIGQSRRASHKALEALDRLGVPVIGSAVTGDTMADGLDRYYQMSPANAQQAAVLADFAVRWKVVLGPDGVGRPATNAVVVYNPDPDDLYSANLASDFKSEFERVRGHHVLAQLPLGENPDGRYRGMSANNVLARACDQLSTRPGILFYAGRVQQFPALVDKLGDVSCPDTLTVLASSDVPKLVTSKTIRLGPGLRLYAAAFAAPGRAGQTAAEGDFYTRFRQDWPTPADSDAALGYDALRAAWQAINKAYVEGGHPDFDFHTVASKLYDGIEFPGASGYIRLDSKHRIPPDKPLLILDWTVGSPGSPAIPLNCGQYDKNKGSRLTSWGPELSAQGNRQGRQPPWPCPQPSPRQP